MKRRAVLAALLLLACSKAKPPPAPPPPAQAEPKEAPPPAIDFDASLSKHIERTGPIPELEVQEVEATGLQPKAAILSHDEKTLYVTNFQQENKRNVSIYDPLTLEHRGDIEFQGSAVEGVLSPDDKTLYVSNFWRHSIMFVDVETKTVRLEAKTGAHPKIVVASPDGKTLYAANWSWDTVTQVNAEDATVTRTIPVGKSPRGMAAASNGTLYVANFYGDSIDVIRGEEKHRISVCRCPRHLVLSPDEKTLYISCLFASQLHALDIVTEQVVHRAPLGSSPKTIAISGNGRYVYSADYGTTRSLSVVDTSNWTSKTFKVPGMDRGSGIAVMGDGEHAFVTGWYDAHVYRVGFVGNGGHPDDARKKTAKWLYKPFSPDPGDTKPGIE